MTLAAAKEKLHDYIEHADEEKIQTMLLFFGREEADRKDLYDEAVLQNLREISEQYDSGKLKTYSLEESMERLKEYRSKDGI